MQSSAGSDSRIDDDLTTVADKTRFRAVPWVFLYTFPWWGLAIVVLGIWVAISIASDQIYSNIFRQLQAGIAMTVRVAVASYISAFLIGLLIGLIRANAPKPRSGLTGRFFSLLHLVAYNFATFFVMVMRGLPILIVLLIFAFVIVPAVRQYLANNLGIVIDIRGSSAESAIIALAFTYGAFLSETFRAGIQSIGRGQVEAARSLGMNYMQMMRFVVLPQAIRRVLPPLGNDFVAMIKDSSLVAILGVNDLTQLAKVSSGASFRYLETYTTVAIIYLSMTIIGSIIVRFIERRAAISD